MSHDGQCSDMANFNTSRVYQGSIPSTPTRKTKITEVNQLVNDLNHEWPSLLLRNRSVLESPSSRAKTPRELCYDRLNWCYYIHPNRLKLCLDDFRLRAKNVEPGLLVSLLIDCLRQIVRANRSKQRLARKAQYARTTGAVH